jgi:hypothetical protein
VENPTGTLCLWLSLTNSNHPLDGNGSITPSGLPYQTFMSLIGTCETGSDRLCCEGFLPPSIVPYPVDIQETPIQVQEPLGSLLVGLLYLDLNNFRDFDQHVRTVRTFSFDQIATANASQSIHAIVTSVANMAGSSAMAQQLMPTTTQ